MKDLKERRLFKKKVRISRRKCIEQVANGIFKARCAMTKKLNDNKNK